MSTIGSIEIQMLADLARLRQDMNDAKGIVGKATADMSKMAGTLKTALGALGVGLSAAAFAGWIKGAINAADEASKLAKAAGIATKDVAGLQLAFKLGGPGADAMSGAMSKLAKQIGENGVVFDTLGIKTRNADGTLRSTKNVLYDTADAFQAMGSGTMATAKAVEIFGKSGADMVPMLLEGSDGLKRMADEAEQLGLVIDEKTGAAAEEFNDTLDLLGASTQGVARQVMAELLPTLQGLAGSMLDTIKNSDLVSRAADGIGAAFKLLYSGVALMIGGFSAFGTYLGSLAAAAVMVSQGEFKQAWSTLNAGWRDAGDIVRGTAKTIEDAWTGSAANTATHAVTINAALKGSTQSTKDYEDAQKAAAQARKDAAAAAAKQAADEFKAVQDIAKARSEARQKEGDDIAKWEIDEAERRNREVKAAGDAVKAAQAEYDNQGLLRSQIAEVTLARLIDKQNAFTAGSENYESVQKEIDSQRELIGILQRGEVRNAATQAAKDAAAEWQKTTDSIGQGLTDSLFRAFESGKGFFDTLWSGIRNVFKTTVLKLVMQPVQQGVNALVAGAIGQAQPASGGGPLGSAALLYGMGQSIYGYGKAASSAVGGWFGMGSNASGAGAFTGSTGTGLATVAGEGATAASASGMSAASMGLWAAAIYAGVVKAQADYEEGNNNDKAIRAQNEAFGGNFGQWSTEGALSSLFSSLGMNDKWSSLLSGSTAVAKIMDTLGLVSSHHSGSVVSIGADGAATTMRGDASGITNNYVEGTDQSLRLLGGTATGLLNSVSTLFGGNGGFGALLKFAADGKDASIGSAQFSRNGMALAGGVGSPGQFALYDKNGAKGFESFIGDVAKATRQSLDAIALPKWARETFAKLSDSATLEDVARTIAQVTEFQTALRGLQTEVSPLGGVFARVAGLSGDALKQLTDFAGGIEAFGQKVGSYVQNYYSEDEQAALSAAALQRSLAGSGVSLDGLTAKSSFRALVDSTDVGSEAGRQQLAALLEASEQFAGISQYLEKSGMNFGQLAALAPSLGALGDPSAGGAQVDGLALVGSAVTSSGSSVVAAIEALQASVEAGLAAVAVSTNATVRQLERWDDGGALLTTNGDDGTGGGGG